MLNENANEMVFEMVEKMDDQTLLEAVTLDVSYLEQLQQEAEVCGDADTASQLLLIAATHRELKNRYIQSTQN